MIEYYINQKDRTGLLQCLDKVLVNSEEYFTIKKALESQVNQQLLQHFSKNFIYAFNATRLKLSFGFF